MKKRMIVAAALMFALGSAPVQAGLFGGKDKNKKTLPPTLSAAERVGQYPLHPTRVKARNRADDYEAGRDFIRRLQRRPVFVSHPYVTGAR